MSGGSSSTPDERSGKNAKVDEGNPEDDWDDLINGDGVSKNLDSETDDDKADSTPEVTKMLVTCKYLRIRATAEKFTAYRIS